MGRPDGNLGGPDGNLKRPIGNLVRPDGYLGKPDGNLGIPVGIIFKCVFKTKKVSRTWYPFQRKLIRKEGRKWKR